MVSSGKEQTPSPRARPFSYPLPLENMNFCACVSTTSIFSGAPGPQGPAAVVSGGNGGRYHGRHLPDHGGARPGQPIVRMRVGQRQGQVALLRDAPRWVGSFCPSAVLPEAGADLVGTCCCLAFYDTHPLSSAAFCLCFFVLAPPLLELWRAMHLVELA